MLQRCQPSKQTNRDKFPEKLPTALTEAERFGIIRKVVRLKEKMNKKLLALLLGGMAHSALGYGEIQGKGGVTPDGYVSPVIANGEMSTTLDFSCSMRSADKSVKNAMPAGIFMAGRRHGGPAWTLFNFGCFASKVTVDGVERDFPDRWVQRLEERRGTLVYEHDYGELKIKSEAFVMFRRNALILRRRATNTGGAAHRLSLGARVEIPKDKLLVGDWKVNPTNGANTCHYQYETYVDWPLGSAGEAWLWTSAKDAVCSVKGATGEVEKELPLKPGESAAIDFIYTLDNFGGIMPREKMTQPTGADTIRGATKPGGVDALQREHELGWREYFAEGYVKIPDAAMQKMWDVANYHVRCDRTPWSFPVGISPSHWNGRYFGFDEMYIHQGMISAGHLRDARHCPDFRYDLLPDAEFSVGHYGRNGGKDGARWMWESLEFGKMEGCPPGFWQQHVFHMGTICRTAWTQYLYSDDLAWLRDKGYPVMTGCARFFLRQMLYRNPDGSVFIGKCTDLERLGPARENAFMTTVGAVYAMRAYAEASELLKTNLVEAAEMREAAVGLMKSLPMDGNRYVGYRGCKEETVATLAGGFPFPVFKRTDKMHAETCRHFITKGASAGGNMYPLGKHICPWYAGKMALSMTLLGDDVEPNRWLRDAAKSIGHFGETFEINEPGIRMHPWFATGSGTLLFAVNQMLLCDAEGELWLGMGVPKEWQDYSFRLPAYHGLIVEAEIRDGLLVRVSATSRNPRAEPVRIRVRNRLLGKGDGESVIEVTNDGSAWRAIPRMQKIWYNMCRKAE